MKTLYCNGISDVQITKETKKASKRIGIASMTAVFAAKREGCLRIIRMSCGNNVGLTVDEYDRFMNIHDNCRQREINALSNMPSL